MRTQPRVEQPEAEPSSRVLELVELSREPGDDEFICTLADWNFMRELGKTFGWRPLGTTYLPQHGERARHKPIKHDYHPGDTRDRKCVETGDSAQWAAALDGARRSPFISGILRARIQTPDAADMGTEQSLNLLLHNFIAFARRGAFAIALKREP